MATEQALPSRGHSLAVEDTDKVPVKIASPQFSDKEKEKEQGMSEKIPYTMLFSFAESLDYILMFLGTIAAVGNGMCMPLMAMLLGDLIDSAGKTASIKVLVHGVCEVSLKFVYLALGSSITSFFQVACWMVSGERQAARIRSLYLKTILRQDIGFFDKETSTGEIVERMSGDTILIQDAMGEKAGKFIQLLSSFLGGFILAFVKGWLLTLVMLSSFPPLVISGALMINFIGKLASRRQTAYSLAATIVEQTIGAIRTVASFTGEQQAISNYNKSLIKTYKSGVQEGLVAGLGLGTVMFILFCNYGFAMWFGGKMIIEKGYNGGDVIIVIVSVLIGSLSMGQASPCLSAFAAGQAAAFKMFETINRQPQIDAYDVNGRKLDDIQGDIELRDVAFSYPTRPDEQILNGFSLSISSGTTAALVGQSGSGKSTVISLIERFYDPQAGEVLIDGVNLKKFQLKWIRDKIGLVSQEPVLFTCSIKDNIAYGKDGATIEEIKAATVLANADNFIKNLPQGLDTMVGEHGIQLSGGQKQRVAIARAILKDPRILLLDEATSALDAGSERMVQEALDKVMINRTTVIVSHRLSTVRNADMIAVIQNGKIVEKGSHSELLKDPDGTYYQFIRLQETRRELKQIAVTYPDSARRSFSAPIATPRFSISERTPEKSFDIPAWGTTQLPQEIPLTRLIYLNRPEMPVLLLGAITSVANGVILPIFGVLLSDIVKTFYEPEDELKRDTKFWALMFVVLGVASLLATPLSMYFFTVAGCKLINRIRSMCFEKVVYMEISWFDEAEHSSGAICARLSTDATAVRSLVGDALALLVQNIATVVAGLVIAFKSNWPLALLILALFPLMGVSGYIRWKSMKGFSKNAKKMYEEASQVASDAVGSIRTVASFCAEEKVMQLYQKKCAGPIKAGLRQGLFSGLGLGLSFFFFFFVYAVSFYVGAILVDRGKATFTEVFHVFFALSMSAVGIAQSTSLAPDVSKTKNSAASVFGILDQISRIDSRNNSGMTLENVNARIEFRQVSFKYPTRPDIEILRNLCLTIHSGTTVALVGESGSGKSTLISLLLRFYDPDSGHITLDGIHIKKLQLKWLRQQIGLVSQEPVLFYDTIRANISYGKEGNATEAEIIAAAELANAHNFISGLQQGYDTSVGERGVQLSGGQKQRVAIARAIVKAPKILLLDEATSALDLESERVVQDALDRVMVDRTTVVVAHRLSTIKGADVIAVIKNGTIVETGKHEMLINVKDGIYASLVAPHTITPN
ncbi:hypothetical protein ACOSQ3_008031 [Xanthoceras sorbifolium]